MPIITIGGLEVEDLRDSLPTNGQYARRLLSGISFLVVHHSGVAVDSTAENVALYHINTNGWPGCAYTFLVHWDGRIELCNDLDRASYHVAYRNAECLGICCLGNWMTETPPQAQLDATLRLTTALQIELDQEVPVEGHCNVALEGYGSSCPGLTWEQWRESVTPVDSTPPAILPLLDSLWGAAARLDTLAVQVKSEAQIVRNYIVQIKQAVGLE